MNRQTFHESWYRVTELKPRLRATVQTRRQFFRGRLWHVISDPSNNSFYRLDDPAYHFVASFDGNRTIGEVWQNAQQQWGDRAPTQGEAIRLLGQLYTSNLIHAEGAGDAVEMFERQRKRVKREVQGQLLSVMSVKIPLYDPDALLERWLFLFGWLFKWPGLVLWAGLLIVAATQLVGHWGKLLNSAAGVLQPDNLFLLYVAFAGIKLIHEFGHAFACKKFGKEEGDGGEVHSMGMMLLVLMPIPYVDASSAWALRNKWRRAFVAAAGMYVELAVAAIAAIIWIQTGSGTIVNALAYNVMFVASVTTLLFNANPLLRYDGYYILSDVFELPNLAQRSKEYMYYLIKKYVYGVKKPRNPAHTRDERRWLLVYAVASTIYRVFLCMFILLYVMNMLFIVGLVLAVVAVIGWVIKPIGQWVRYLATGPELARTRPRAVLSTAVILAVLLSVIGLIRVPDRDRAEAIVEARHMVQVHMLTDGFVRHVLQPGKTVTPQDHILLTAQNPELEARRRQLVARLELAQTRRRAALLGEPALAQSLSDQGDALRAQIARVDEQLAWLEIRPQIAGTWVVEDVSRFDGAYLRRGDTIGRIATVDDLVVRVVADQRLGPRILPEVGIGGHVDIRIKGRPDMQFTGTVTRVLPAGQTRLPSRALGYLAGGSIRVDTDDAQGTLAAEPFFEIHVRPEFVEGDDIRLFTGQRVMVRFELPSRPVLSQGWRSLRQLIQQRMEG